MAFYPFIHQKPKLKEPEQLPLYIEADEYISELIIEPEKDDPKVVIIDIFGETSE